MVGGGRSKSAVSCWAGGFQRVDKRAGEAETKRRVPVALGAIAAATGGLWRIERWHSLPQLRAENPAPAGKWCDRRQQVILPSQPHCVPLQEAASASKETGCRNRNATSAEAINRAVPVSIKPSIPAR